MNNKIEFTEAQLEEMRVAIFAQIDMYEQHIDEGEEGYGSLLRTNKAALKKIEQLQFCQGRTQ